MPSLLVFDSTAGAILIQIELIVVGAFQGNAQSLSDKIEFLRDVYVHIQLSGVLLFITCTEERTETVTNFHR